MSQEQQVQETAVAAKPVVRISDCKRMLKEGMTRKEIAVHYGYPMSAMAEKVWSNPELKGLKTKKIFNIEVIDDTKELVEQSTVDLEVASPVSEVATEANEAFPSNLQAEVGEVELVEPVSGNNDWN